MSTMPGTKTKKHDTAKGRHARIALIALLAIAGAVFLLKRKGGSSSAVATVPADTTAPVETSLGGTSSDLSGSGSGSSVDPLALDAFSQQLDALDAYVSALPVASVPAAADPGATAAPSAAVPAVSLDAPAGSTTPAAIPAAATPAPPVPVSTAVKLQATVAAPSAKAVYPTATRPIAVKVTANPTGGSANKKQGVFSIH